MTTWLSPSQQNVECKSCQQMSGTGACQSRNYQSTAGWRYIGL